MTVVPSSAKSSKETVSKIAVKRKAPPPQPSSKRRKEATVTEVTAAQQSVAAAEPTQPVNTVPEAEKSHTTVSEHKAAVFYCTKISTSDNYAYNQNN